MNEFYENFRHGSDDQMWQITLEKIEGIKEEIKEKRHSAKMNAMFVELTGTANDFIESTQYSKIEKIEIINSLIAFFCMLEEYEKCIELSGIIKLL